MEKADNMISRKIHMLYVYVQCDIYIVAPFAWASMYI